MPIRVAYDVSVVAANYAAIGVRSGLARVIEEVLLELGRRPGVDLTLVGTGAWAHIRQLPIMSDLVADYGRSAGSASAGAAAHVFATTQSYRSRSGLAAMYDRAGVRRYLRSVPRPVRRYGPTWLADRSARWAMTRLMGWDAAVHVDAGRYDVFHSPFVGLPPRRATGRLPRVLTVYDLIPVLHPFCVGRQFTQYFRHVLASVDVRRDWAVAISQHTKDEFCQHTGMSPDRVAVTPLAAADHFQPVDDPDRRAEVRRRYAVPGGRYFLSVATHQPNKNLPHLVRCFLSLLRRDPSADVSLVLTGFSSGATADEVRGLVAAAADVPGAASRVAFTGFVEERDLAPLYSGATAFVFPSLFEGFGLPPLEAMRCGVPVITSNSTSLPEVVGDAGLMVDPTDADALVAAMARLLADEPFRRDLAARGLERSSRFSWSRCADQLLSVYERAIAEQ